MRKQEEQIASGPSGCRINPHILNILLYPCASGVWYNKERVLENE